NSLHYFAEHIGETILPSLKTVGEPFVIQTKSVKNGRLQVMNVHRIFNDVEREIVRFSVGDSWFDPATGHPDRKSATMMIAPVVVFGEATLAINGPTELPAPHDQSVIEQTTQFEIGHQGSRC